MYSRYQTLDTQAHYFRILANPKRLQVILLLQRGQLTVSDMGRIVGLRQPNLSQHLMVLRHAGLVDSEHKGRKVYYRLTYPDLTPISTIMFIARMAGRIVGTKKYS